MDRDSRFINNRKQDKIRLVNNHPSINNMREGEEVLFNHKDGILKRYRKQNGRLWSSNMSTDGNTIVDKKLIANELEYKQKFLDYRVFAHNFNKDLDTDETYLPWGFNGSDKTTFGVTHGYLTPFKMICHKFIFRPPNLTDSTDDITFAIKKIDNGDNTEDLVCNYTYSTTFVDYTSITINTSDWSANPVIESGNIGLITIDASDTGITTSGMDFFITSVWKTFIGV